MAKKASENSEDADPAARGQTQDGSALIGAFVLATAPVYAAIFGVIAFALIMYLTLTDQFDSSCGGLPACTTIDIITKIVVLTVAMVLLAAGLAGNLIALVLAILLLKQILTGRI